MGVQMHVLGSRKGQAGHDQKVMFTSGCPISLDPSMFFKLQPTSPYYTVYYLSQLVPKILRPPNPKF
jgi:hypothetical protein